MRLFVNPAGINRTLVLFFSYLTGYTLIALFSTQQVENALMERLKSHIYAITDSCGR